jgi:predicted thioredoxin/glutaredoxin
MMVDSRIVVTIEHALIEQRTRLESDLKEVEENNKSVYKEKSVEILKKHIHDSVDALYWLQVTR